MSSRDLRSVHTAEEEWLAAFAAGGLSCAKRLVVACQAAVEPRIASLLQELDQFGGAFIESAKGEAVSEGFMNRLGRALDRTADDQPVARSETEPGKREKNPEWMPQPLAEFIDRTGLNVKWRNAGPGVQRAPLVNDDGEQLYLLKIRPGFKVPEHSHRGEEWMLLLQGGYHVGDQGYVRGDLHREDESCTHQPVIDDDGEDCIALVAVEGRLKFKDPLMKLFQPFVGI